MGIFVPTREQILGFKNMDRDETIHMLNLLKYKKHADYEEAPYDGADPNVSGKEAYLRYKKVFCDWVEARGGKLIWDAKVDFQFIGEDEEWDEAFIALYPKAQDFRDMQFDETYQPALQHRSAGLEKSIILRCTPFE